MNPHRIASDCGVLFLEQVKWTFFDLLPINEQAATLTKFLSVAEQLRTSASCS